ncbi:MAG: hypothetical protein IPG78_10870 [Ignavibacteria bacterium]|nr:hypothetical protein [Ignavibacteria bacterium]
MKSPTSQSRKSLVVILKTTKEKVMIVSITKIELKSYSKLIGFFKFNGKIINELKQSKNKKYQVTASWNLRDLYTMTLWVNENDINDFYRNGTHIEAMKQSKNFSSKIQSKRIQQEDLISWKEAKKLFVNTF